MGWRTVASLWLLVCLLPMTSSIAAASKHRSETAAKPEAFEVVDPAKIVCSMPGSFWSANYGQTLLIAMGGNLHMATFVPEIKEPPVRGTDVTLICHMPDNATAVGIELLSQDAEKGVIKTKQFGTIKIMVGPITDTFSMAMKPSDEAWLEEFVKKGNP